MKTNTIRFSIIISIPGHATTSVTWYDGATLCHYTKTDIHIDTLPTGRYYFTLDAHLLQNVTMSILIDDITDLRNPQRLLNYVSNSVITSVNMHYDVA